MTMDDGIPSPIERALYLAQTTSLDDTHQQAEIDAALRVLQVTNPGSLSTVTSALLELLHSQDSALDAGRLARPDAEPEIPLWNQAVDHVQRLRTHHAHSLTPGPSRTAPPDQDGPLARAVCHVLILLQARALSAYHGTWIRAQAAYTRVANFNDDNDLLADHTGAEAAENGQLIWLAALDLADATADPVSGGALADLVRQELGNPPTLCAITGLNGRTSDGDQDLHALAAELTAASHGEPVDAVQTGPDSVLLLARTIVQPRRWHDPRIGGTDPDLAGWLHADVWGQRMWITARRHRRDGLPAAAIPSEQAMSPRLVMGTAPSAHRQELTGPGDWIPVSADSWRSPRPVRPHILMSAATPGVPVGLPRAREGHLPSGACFSLATARAHPRQRPRTAGGAGPTRPPPGHRPPLTTAIQPPQAHHITNPAGHTAATAQGNSP